MFPAYNRGKRRLSQPLALSHPFPLTFGILFDDFSTHPFLATHLRFQLFVG